MFGMRIRAALVAAPVLVFAVAGSTQGFATTLYSQGFESNTDGWFSPTRVISGTDGITSASGSYHAKTFQSAGDFTRWGGYNSTTGGSPGAFVPYTTSLGIYLDVSAGAANDTRFDFSSAINNTLGDHLRDFVFNAGFYDNGDVTGPGAGTNRFVISAGNNANRDSSNPKNPDHDPIAISTTGWYTFQSDFVDNGGFLNVDMSILDSIGNIVAFWVLDNSGSPDPIAGVGGNRYGWFANNEFSFLAIDDASLAAAPIPATLPMFASGLGALGLLRWRKKRKSLVAAA